MSSTDFRGTDYEAGNETVFVDIIDAGVLKIGGVQLWANAISSTTTYDPASVTTYTGTTSAGITVTGAALGDFVVVSAPYDLVGVIVSGYVSAANTIKITCFNATAGTVDLTSGTWKIKVLRG